MTLELRVSRPSSNPVSPKKSPGPSLAISVPVSPGRRRLAVMNFGGACAYHARCEACNASEATCDDVYHHYFYYDWKDDEWDAYSGNPQAAAALEPDVFATWCAKYNHTYARR